MVDPDWSKAPLSKEQELYQLLYLSQLIYSMSYALIRVLPTIIVNRQSLVKTPIRIFLTKSIYCLIAGSVVTFFLRVMVRSSDHESLMYICIVGRYLGSLPAQKVS